ncbi:hypothetical protein DITRI_Ditri19aG0060000 [Diplodiscus trichospermus]
MVFRHYFVKNNITILVNLSSSLHWQSIYVGLHWTEVRKVKRLSGSGLFILPVLLGGRELLVDEIQSYLSDEAVTCLNVIENDQLASQSEGNDIPLIQSLMEGDLSLQFLYENQQNTIQADSQQQQVMSHTSHQPEVQPGLPQMGFGPGDVGLSLELRK